MAALCISQKGRPSLATLLNHRVWPRQSQFLPLRQGCVTLTDSLWMERRPVSHTQDECPGSRGAGLRGSCLQAGLPRAHPQPWRDLSAQDSQTDSGMVLASEEFEQLESRHREESRLR